VAKNSGRWRLERIRLEERGICAEIAAWGRSVRENLGFLAVDAPEGAIQSALRLPHFSIDALSHGAGAREVVGGVCAASVEHTGASLDSVEEWVRGKFPAADPFAHTAHDARCTYQRARLFVRGLKHEPKTFREIEAFAVTYDWHSILTVGVVRAEGCVAAPWPQEPFNLVAVVQDAAGTWYGRAWGECRVAPVATSLARAGRTKTTLEASFTVLLDRRDFERLGVGA
jgi:hypothetical protein